MFQIIASKIKCQLKFHPNKIFFLFFLLHASIFEVKVGLFGIRCISKTKTTETKSLCEVFRFSMLASLKQQFQMHHTSLYFFLILVSAST